KRRLQPVAGDLPESDGDGGRDRPFRTPFGDPRVCRAELSHGRGYRDPGPASIARRRLWARGHREEDGIGSARPEPPGGRKEEMNPNPLWGAFEDRAGEEISGQAGISLPPKSHDRRLGQPAEIIVSNRKKRLT